ncbi:hypothetical protein COCNU_scaffold004370G000010 [Cocos nucifera]|nr:hypothetical protein [Cocos nucifera]
MKMVNSSFTEEAIKALYATSALIRNNEVGQKLFYSEDGNIMLQDIMTNSSMDIRLQKKAVFLVADLADYQLGNADNAELSFLSDRLFLKAVVDLTSVPDLDLQEKALMAIRSLLQLTSTKALDFKDFCSLDEVLERMREHLDKLMSQEEHTEYARDLESLRREVYIIFHQKVEQILAYGALTKLMKMVNSSFTEEAIKALYATSALIRNNEVGQKLFYSEDGNIMLQDIMTNSSMDIRLQKKAVFLVADLADYQLGNADNAELSFLSDRLFLKAVVDLTSVPDLDLQEKALMAIRSLLQLTSTKALDFKDFCSLDEVLERMREHLDKLMSQEEHTEYARDLESLRREVYIIFHQKVEQVTWVPT